MRTRAARRDLLFGSLLVPLAQLLVGQLLFCQSHELKAKQPHEYTFKIVKAFPHDRTAFTQGLAYRDGFLYEGTGLNGRSSLRKVRLQTGEVVREVELTSEFFGEGITLIKNQIVQLAW